MTELFCSAGLIRIHRSCLALGKYVAVFQLIVVTTYVHFFDTIQRQNGMSMKSIWDNEYELCNNIKIHQ